MRNQPSSKLGFVPIKPVLTHLLDTIVLLIANSSNQLVAHAARFKSRLKRVFSELVIRISSVTLLTIGFNSCANGNFAAKPELDWQLYAYM